MKSLFSKKLILGIVLVLGLSLASNLLALALPRVASEALTGVFSGKSDLTEFQTTYLGFIVAILVVAVIQTVAANVITENFASTLRDKMIAKISQLSYNTVNALTPSRLLTNITSDVDAIKALFNQGVVMMFSSVVLIVGASISMLSLNAGLALIVMVVIPALFIAFGVIFRAIGKFFKEAQENLDKLNKIINESIVGSALVKVLNSQAWETAKFSQMNEVSRKTNIKIVFGFASLIPIITILSNAALLAVVYFGGAGVIEFINTQGASGLTPGDYAAFFSYVGTFIMPILMIGFISSTIARSAASLKRINESLQAKELKHRSGKALDIKGNIEFKKVSLEIKNKAILRDVSFSIKAGSKVAIVGPTAAGKTQIFNLIAGLQEPTGGKILIDGAEADEVEINSFYSQVALVFQDSVIFNTTVRENILFNGESDEQNLRRAVETAELDEFVAAQEHGLETIISERGASLSGGQKQRLTLARALAINPKVLLLDDFTARVDINTERKIIENLAKNYPGLTLISITQKIESIKDYDQVILLMEGELLATGTHKELLEKSFEYQQIYNSQKTTE